MRKGKIGDFCLGFDVFVQKTEEKLGVDLHISGISICSIFVDSWIEEGLAASAGHSPVAMLAHLIVQIQPLDGSVRHSHMPRGFR